MRLGRRMLLACAIALLVLETACPAFASSWVQRKVSSGEFPIHTACMMPPQGHLTRIGVKGAEGLTAESEAWAGALEALIEFHLNVAGVRINHSANLFSSGASEDELRGVISEIQQKFRTVSALMDRKPGRISKSAYTLSDEVGMLPCSGVSDILVFVQGAGQVFTKGRGAMSLVIGGPAETAVLLVTLADAKTGEILGLIRVGPEGDFASKPEDAFGEQVDYELANMNVGSARRNAKAAGHWQ